MGPCTYSISTSLSGLSPQPWLIALVTQRPGYKVVGPLLQFFYQSEINVLDMETDLCGVQSPFLLVAFVSLQVCDRSFLFLLSCWLEVALKSRCHFWLLVI